MSKRRRVRRFVAVIFVALASAAIGGPQIHLGMPAPNGMSAL
jgi:hypothetical protein